jgi:signal transduction histidine kinase/CheY-like chemotaxis protein
MHVEEWLMERAGAAVVREEAHGAVVPHGRARELLGRGSYPSFGTALLQLLGSQTSRADIDNAIAHARTGASTELVGVGGVRVLVAPDLGSRVKAVIVQRASEATGQEVAARVSHELANALGAIAGWARLAKQGHRVSEALGLIEMSADSAWSAARRLLGDARPQESATGVHIDLSAFVDEASKLLAPKALAKGVRVQTALEPGLRVRGDRGSAWSIVWNLGTNAVEALGAGGCVELRVSAAGEDVVLEVEDDGPGMSDEHQRRAFDAYFTTKSTGTGLGLSLVKQAVTDLGGRVEVDSRLARGTRFRVVLPRWTAAPRVAPNKRSSGVFYAEPIHQRVLVVDDDLGLREMIATALGMRGAEVVAVADARAALEQREPFGLVLLDLNLSDVRGDVLLSALRSSGVATLGLLMSGGEMPEHTAAGGEPDGVLRKPFELEELFETLATLLGDPSQAKSHSDRSAAG